MVLVHKWLNGNRNYTAGCILYNQYGKDEAVKQMLSKGESAANKQKLLVAMQALITPVEKHSTGSFVKQEPTSSGSSGEESLQNMPAGTDAVTASIQEEWKQHYTAMNMLRGKLQAYGEDNSPEAVEACRVLSLDILNHEQHITACWEKLNYYKNHGKLPQEPAEEKFEIPGDSVELGKLIESLKRNIRRNKQKAAVEPANPLYPSLVKKYEDRLKQIQDAQN